MKRNKIVLGMLILTAFLLGACQKDKAPTKDVDQEKPKKVEAIAKNVGETKVADMKKVKSTKSFDETVKRVEQFLKEKNITLFLIVDHKENAKGVQLQMNETKVLYFGDPKVGTTLMQDQPEIAFDLPLRLAVVKEGEDVYFVYQEPSSYQSKYQLKDESKKILTKMDGLYKNILTFVNQ